MEAHELAETACDAIQVALQRHEKRNAKLTKDDREDVKAHIESIFALRRHAADENVALLEIACDAAAQFADDYNYQNPTSTPIEPKWIYILVQALLVPQLKPELVSGNVPRLSELVDSGEAITSVDSESSAGEGNSTTKDSDEYTTVQAHTDNSGPQWAQAKPSLGRRSIWRTQEIKQLIWLHKYKEITQAEAARRLGRSLPSVTNRWRRIQEEQEWKAYQAECETMRSQGRDLPRPATPT